MFKGTQVYSMALTGATQSGKNNDDQGQILGNPCFAYGGKLKEQCYVFGADTVNSIRNSELQKLRLLAQNSFDRVDV